MKKPKSLAIVGVMMLATYPWAASAQFDDGLSQTAMAIQAYEKSSDRCFYEPIVGQAINRLRDHYAETEPYRWQRALRESKDADDILGNATAFALQGSPYTVDPRVSGTSKPAAPRDSRCVGSGLGVGAALPFAAALIGFDQTLFAEANRLMEGKGRFRQSASTSPTESSTSSTPPTGQTIEPRVGSAASAMQCQNTTTQYRADYDLSARTFKVDNTQYKVLAIEETGQRTFIAGLSVNDGPFFRAEIRPEKKIEFFVGSKLFQTDRCR